MDCGACGVETAAVDRNYTRQNVIDAFCKVGVDCGKCSYLAEGHGDHKRDWKCDTATI